MQRRPRSEAPTATRAASSPGQFVKRPPASSLHSMLGGSSPGKARNSYCGSLSPACPSPTPASAARSFRRRSRSRPSGCRLGDADQVHALIEGVELLHGLAEIHDVLHEGVQVLPRSSSRSLAGVSRSRPRLPEPGPPVDPRIPLARRCSAAGPIPGDGGWRRCIGLIAAARQVNSRQLTAQEHVVGVVPLAAVDGEGRPIAPLASLVLDRRSRSVPPGLRTRSRAPRKGTIPTRRTAPTCAPGGPLAARARSNRRSSAPGLPGAQAARTRQLRGVGRARGPRGPGLGRFGSEAPAALAARELEQDQIGAAAARCRWRGRADGRIRFRRARRRGSQTGDRRLRTRSRAPPRCTSSIDPSGRRCAPCARIIRSIRSSFRSTEPIECDRRRAAGSADAAAEPARQSSANKQQKRKAATDHGAPPRARPRRHRIPRPAAD